MLIFIYRVEGNVNGDLPDSQGQKKCKGKGWGVAWQFESAFPEKQGQARSGLLVFEYLLIKPCNLFLSILER